MKKVKITRSCLVKGVHYAKDATADLSDGDADLLVGIGKAVAHECRDQDKKKKAKK